MTSSPAMKIFHFTGMAESHASLVHFFSSDFRSSEAEFMQ